MEVSLESGVVSREEEGRESGIAGLETVVILNPYKWKDQQYKYLLSFHYLLSLLSKFRCKRNLYMLTINPQYITDNTGKKLSVILPIKEFTNIMEEIEESEDIRLYDAAKKEDDGKRILFSDYLKKRASKKS